MEFPDRAPSSAAQFDDFSFRLGMPNTKTRSLEEIGTENGLRSPKMVKIDPKWPKKEFERHCWFYCKTNEKWTFMPKITFRRSESSKNPYKTCLECDSGLKMMVKGCLFYCRTNGNGPFLKKGASELANSIAQPDVFEENGSKRGSKMAPTLIKPMENHQMGIPGSIFFVQSIFFV